MQRWCIKKVKSNLVHQTANYGYETNKYLTSHIAIYLPKIIFAKKTNRH